MEQVKNYKSLKLKKKFLHLSPHLGKCLECGKLIDKCVECDEASTCKRCEANYFLTDPNASGKFTACTACSSPTTYREKNESTNGTGVCKKCVLLDSNCLECTANGTICTKCIRDKFLFSSGVCGDCNSAENFPTIASTDGQGNIFY